MLATYYADRHTLAKSMGDSANRQVSVRIREHAKRFFVDKIVAEAAAELRPLSDSECQMLSFSESDHPEFVVDPALVNKLAAKISDEDYAAKVAGLLKRAYQRDVARDSRERDTYREAYEVLNQGRSLFADHDQSSVGPAVEAMVGFLALAVANKA